MFSPNLYPIILIFKPINFSIEDHFQRALFGVDIFVCLNMERFKHTSKHSYFNYLSGAQDN